MLLGLMKMEWIVLWLDLKQLVFVHIVSNNIKPILNNYLLLDQFYCHVKNLVVVNIIITNEIDFKEIIDYLN
jgi:hypothetical protein